MTTTSAAAPVLVAPVRDRPPDALVERFRQVPAAMVGDALERLWVLEGDIRSMWPGATCAGPALPVYTRAGDNLAVHRALDIARPGDVLVVNGQGDTTRALLGGLLARRAQELGLAGIVVDGAVRDVDEIEAVGLPVFARASTPAGPYKNGPAEIGLPVACGGVVCSPGDIVCGDADGVAVVPLTRAARVADAVAEILQYERELARRWFGEG
jgi:RraA family protein